jgi:tRNA threonylcarbamoyladenosine biosynthesis protein TsaB
VDGRRWSPAFRPIFPQKAGANGLPRARIILRIVMLRILALETSGMTGSVSAAIDDKVMAEIDLGPRQRSAQSLAPAMKAVLEQLGWQPRDVGLVAVTAGPGSFTGLRVGVATAKVFAYATKAEVLGISTLEVIAAAAPSQIDKLSVGIDAQRGDVVAQDFQLRPAGGVESLGPDRLVPLADWLAGLPPGFAVSGSVLKKWTELIPPGIEVMPAESWQPTAANVARLAYRDYLAGRRDDIWRLLPVYSRPSAAEEKMAKSHVLR